MYPPLPVQLARLANYFGFAPKDQDIPESQTPQQMEEQGAALLDMFPMAPVPKIMSAEEYLRQKEIHHG